MKQAIQLCGMNEVYRQLWIDLNRKVKTFTKSRHHISPQIDMDQGVCQGGLSSLPTYNLSTDSMPKWIETLNEGYEIGNAKLPNTCIRR